MHLGSLLVGTTVAPVIERLLPVSALYTVSVFPNRSAPEAWFSYSVTTTTPSTVCSRGVPLF